MKKRAISQRMMESLLSGALRPMLEAVQRDDTLCMEPRGNSVSVYYRGGSLFQIMEKPNGYEIVFDTNYCREEQCPLPGKPDVETALRLLPQYKQAVDYWHPRYVREVQQVIQRENNLQKAAGLTTDYFFLDMACEDSSRRFDMVAIKWPEKSLPRRKHLPPTLALIEIIYDNALSYIRKMKEYLSDLDAFLSDQEQTRAFLEDMSEVFSQKCRLGLIQGVQEPLFDTKILPETPEVILVCVHQEASSRGVDVLIHRLDIGAYHFPVFVASASMMGYGMYVEKMRLL